MGKTVKLEDGSLVEFQGDPKKSVKDGGALLGKGGQGAVYKVKNQSTGQMLALKIFSEPMTSAFIDEIRRKITMGAPHSSFLWPVGLTEPLGSNGDRYGYVMDLYGKEYSSFPKLIKGQVVFPTKELQIATLIDLVDAVGVLHAKGYYHPDLNDGNLFVDCPHGKVLIGGSEDIAPMPITGFEPYLLGKFKYMAPEVAIEMFKPDKYSDRFSLAVLMFLMLTHAHPYDGAKRLLGPLTPALQQKVYGMEPVFIFHPTDSSNRPDPQIDANAIAAWPLLPSFIQELFIKTFTSGMPYIGCSRADLERARMNRTSEQEWKTALHRWMDTL